VGDKAQRRLLTLDRWRRSVLQSWAEEARRGDGARKERPEGGTWRGTGEAARRLAVISLDLCARLQTGEPGYRPHRAEEL